MCFHKNGCVARKKSVGGVLSFLDRMVNRCFVCVRILVEYVNVEIKVFRVVVNGYWNRCRWFGL